jgi:nucleotide-binding universal stress UspA family protein
MPARTIIVPLDGSDLAERALPVATTLAGKVGAGLLLVSAPWDSDRDLVRRYLDTVAGRVGVDDVEVRATEDRRPADSIVAALNEGADRVVCMTTHGRGRFRWSVVGSVAEEVLQHSDGPTVLVGRRSRADAVGSDGPVLVGVDGSPVSAEVVPVACEWAQALGRAVTVAFVSHPLDVEDAVHPDAVVGPAADLVRAAGLPVETKLVRSSFPAGALADLAEDSSAALIAMTTHARSGLSRVTLGSVTMGVLNEAPCPVLAVHPRTTS